MIFLLVTAQQQVKINNSNYILFCDLNAFLAKKLHLLHVFSKTCFMRNTLKGLLADGVTYLNLMFVGPTEDFSLKFKKKRLENIIEDR